MKKPLTKEESIRKARIVQRLNAVILPFFGVLFIFLATKKELATVEGKALLVFGIVFMVYGSLRARMIARLIHEVEQEKDNVEE